MYNKVFLGGTCADTTWRDELIPILESKRIDYFNPVVKDWTEDCIKIEENEKDNKCNIHLYLITSEMKGVYSIAEVMASSLTGVKTIFIVQGDGFSEGELKSLTATANLARKHSAGNLVVHFMNKNEGLEIVPHMVECLSPTKKEWYSSYVEGILNR